ncbi:MAG: peptidase S41 [Finegoldia magna]|uniref:peptidase S41 n=1 Tax=Finegoldia magna TaxID=1260 RepID=UPI00290A56A9|nr:peptidase S41 [Finegoldia magna]MDU7331097.1 peptidase S41 [Finegoldia magna]
MKIIKTITLVSVLIISLLFTSTNIFAENELDNIEVLTFSVDSMYDKGNLDTNKEKHKKLGEIELNRVLSKEDYIKDVNNFKSFYIHEQGYLGGYTKEQLNSDIDKLLQNPTGNTVGDLNLQLSKIISNMNDGHTTAMSFLGTEQFPFIIKIIGDEFYIINTTEKYKDLLYSKIVSIEGAKSSEILKIVCKYISAENETGRKYLLHHGYMLYTDLLKKENIIKGDKVHFQILQNGKIVDKTVDTIKTDNIGIYKSYYDNESYNQIMYDTSELKWDAYTNWGKEQFTENKPFYFYKSNRNLVIKYNYSSDINKDNVLKDMITKMQNEIQAKDIDNIILDIRYNGGGMDYHTKQLEFAIMQYQLLNPKINIKVLTGEEIYSAGIRMLDSVKRNLENIQMIGTNTAGASNYNMSVGNIVYLGKSRLFIYTSGEMRRYDYTFKDVIHSSNLNKGDGSTWYPDMFIENQIQDYAIGNDRVMNYALKNN